MILLDTNVVSEAMKPDRHPNVEAWMERLDHKETAIPAIALEELRYGVLSLPNGRRRAALSDALDLILDFFPILPFDTRAAEVCAATRAFLSDAGKIVELPDIQIAGIAFANGASVATRNVRDFTNMSVEIVNPWETA